MTGTGGPQPLDWACMYLKNPALQFCSAFSSLCHRRWKWLFALEGAATVIFGIVFYVSLTFEVQEHTPPTGSVTMSLIFSCLPAMACACVR